MNNPAPIDTSRLKGMLMGAKALMDKVETGNYQTGNVNIDTSITGDQLVESVHGNQNTGGENTTNVAPKIVGGKPIYKNLESSRMPKSIKEAMLKQPIPQMSMANNTFTLDDVSDLIEKPLPKNMPLTKRPQILETHQPISQVNDTFTVSETALRGIIQDVVNKQLLEFMSETFAKKLTEEAIKKTINTLIKEGKISTKKRV